MTQRLTKLIPLLILAIGFVVSAGLYLTLISNNCDGSGASDFIASVRAFHTQAGC